MGADQPRLKIALILKWYRQIRGLVSPEFAKLPTIFARYILTYFSVSRAKRVLIPFSICPCYTFKVSLEKLTFFFQIRLDFDSFVISGPSTQSTTIGHVLGSAILGVAGGVAVAESGQCLTDTFNIRNQYNVPVICGTLTGEHGK